MKQLSHLGGCTGFWLWALVGAVAAFGFISAFGWFLLIPAIGLAYLVQRRPEWKGGSILLGMISGAGLPLLFVAGLNWSDWHQRTPGNEIPNPFDWGGVGVALVVAGIFAYAVDRRHA